MLDISKPCEQAACGCDEPGRWVERKKEKDCKLPVSDNLGGGDSNQFGYHNSEGRSPVASQRAEQEALVLLREKAGGRRQRGGWEETLIWRGINTHHADRNRRPRLNTRQETSSPFNRLGVSAISHLWARNCYPRVDGPPVGQLGEFKKKSDFLRGRLGECKG